MTTRRVIFFGKLPARLKEALVSQYQVTITLDAEALAKTGDEWKIAALRSGGYDLLIVDGSLAQGSKLAAVVQQTHPHIPTIIANGEDADTLLQRVLTTTQWIPAGKTVYVVVMSIKGGVGKSTTAGSLAEILSTDHKRRVLAVDDNAHQANMVRFFTDTTVPMMGADDIKRATTNVLSPFVFSVHSGLDLLAPEEYTAQGGLTYGVARNFWAAVGGLGHDYVVVDTSPNLSVPNTPQEWQEVYLTYALLTGGFPCVYIVPFTPVEWGHAGLEAARDILARFNQLEWMIPVVTATDALHVLEYVPDWLRDNQWKSRYYTVGYNRAVKDNPRVAALQKKLLTNPRQAYQPLLERVLALSEKRLG